jgi:hypothetical protein
VNKLWFSTSSGLVVKTTCCVKYHCGSSPAEVILWFEMCWILIIQFRRKRLRWITRDLFQQRASGLAVKTTCCVMYHCGSSPTDVILWLEMCWILIIQFRRKRLWWISCDRFQQRASGLVVKTIRCVRYYWGLSRTEFILWFKNGWILIIQSREKG